MDTFPIILDNIRQSTLQILHRQLILVASPRRGRIVHLPRRDQHMVNDMDVPVAGEGILERHALVAVDLQGRVGPVAGDVDSQRAVGQEGGQIEMGEALDAEGLDLAVLGVVHVGVESAVGHDVVLQQGAEVLVPAGREEEGVDLQAELLEGGVGGGEDGAAVVGVRAGQDSGGFVGGQAGGEDAQGKGAELRGDDLEERAGVWWGEEDGVDAVNYAVGAGLVGGLVCLLYTGGGEGLQCRWQ